MKKRHTKPPFKTHFIVNDKTSLASKKAIPTLCGMKKKSFRPIWVTVYPKAITCKTCKKMYSKNLAFFKKVMYIKEV